MYAVLAHQGHLYAYPTNNNLGGWSSTKSVFDFLIIIYFHSLHINIKTSSQLLTATVSAVR